MIGNIKNWLVSHAAYKRTVRELSCMSDRDLYDIGIDRDMIESVAAGATNNVYSQSHMSFFDTLFGFFKFENIKTEKHLIDAWLADSVDIVDLERKLKMLDLNQAPWQSAPSKHLQGWT